MICINLAIFLLAMLPIIVALIYSLAIRPRRKANMQALIELCLDNATGNGSTTSADGNDRSLKPEHTRYIRSGLDRVEQDFDSQYTYRLFVPATLLAFLYLVTLFMGMSQTAGNSSAQCWFLRMPAYYSTLPTYEFALYAFAGAYVFNAGVLIRRTFLADVTEHVYWGAINRLIIATGLALAFHGVVTRSPSLFFVVAFMPQVLLTKLRKHFTSLLGDKNNDELDGPLQKVQGIDIWKEQRLQEEGIENIQNLATMDVLTLAVKTHYPLRTLIDWIDQAIFIQRFPNAVDRARSRGLAVSAIEMAWMAPSNGDQGTCAAKAVARALELDNDMVTLAMDAFYQDSYVEILWALWQVADRDTQHSTMARMSASPAVAGQVP